MRSLTKILYTTKPCIKLAKVSETESKRTWIFTFVDPIHKFMQSVILVKDHGNPAEKMEAMMENIWVSWNDKIRECNWSSRLPMV